MNSRNEDTPRSNPGSGPDAAPMDAGASKSNLTPGDTPLQIAALTRLDARKLMAGRRALVLELDGQQYVLRLTSNNKLILTK